MRDPSALPHLVAVRLFFTDAHAAPVAGLVVSIFTETVTDPPIYEEPPPQTFPLHSTAALDGSLSGDAPPDGDLSAGTPILPQQQPVREIRQLATLQTDQAGYVSFKLERALIATASRLAARYGTASPAELTLDIGSIFAGDDSVSVQVDANAIGSVSPVMLPSVIDADARDLALSPGSIGLIPQLTTSGLCRQLMPTSLGARRFRAIQVVAGICNTETANCRDKPVEIARGKVHEYEIVWHPAGTSLGDLLNTITLAPCEQVNIAISDWTRQERSSRDETSEQQQRTAQEMNHDRLIGETMNSSVRAESFAWGLGATLAGPIKDITASLSGSLGGTSSTHDMVVSTSSALSDRIAQTATFVGSRRSSVVFQSVQSEQQTVQTRTVRNHNHCHTLTLAYYQVNRGYRVVTDYKGARDVLLVRAEKRPFDAMRAYELSDILKPTLLDPSLAGAFDELADALFCCELKPPEEPSERRVDSLVMTFWVQEKSGSPWWFLGTLTHTGGTVHFGGSAMQPPLHNWQPGGVYSITVPLPTPIDPASLVSTVLTLTGDPINIGSFTFNKLEITARIAGTSDAVVVYRETNPISIEAKAQSRLISWLKAEPEETTPSSANPCIEKSCAIRKLLAHLNAHARYYNTAVLFHQDPNDRVMHWSCCRKDEQEFDLITHIDNQPLTVYGDYVVFPAAGSVLVDDPLVQPVAKLVLLPTAGVYSEGLLGQCNTCEITDPNRFWDWQESPCPDNAPATGNAPSPGSGATSSDLKAETITNLVTLNSAPEVAPTILKDLISTLVSSADGGSTAAKEILSKLLDTIKETFPKPK